MRMAIQSAIHYPGFISANTFLTINFHDSFMVFLVNEEEEKKNERRFIDSVATSKTQ